MALSDEEIAESVESVVREANPNTPFTSLNDVVRQVESKLGIDLSHKIDFIRNHIQFLFRPQQQPSPPPQKQPILHHQNDLFAPHQQKDNFTHKDRFATHHHQQQPHVGFQSGAAAVSTDVPFRAKHPKVEGYNGTIEQPAAAVAPTEAPFRAKDPKVEGYYGNNEQPPATTAETSKESAQKGKKRRGGPGGLNKLCGVSPLLQAIVGHPALPRTEIVKQLWIYIRKNNLQDPSNKRKIICNDELRLVFETDCTDMFKMNKLLAKHIISLEPSKQTTQNSKKSKYEIESESKSLDTVPIVIISEALASFFGTNEREISQAEVLRQVWEYIKVNQLEDPLNAMVIHCDAKLQELLGCESISALGIPEMLSRRHLFKKL